MTNTDITIHENELTPEEFIALFTAVGWTPPGIEQVRAALAGSLAVFSAECCGKTAAMARVTGDGAMTFLIKDVAVAPEFQGKGLGRLLISFAEDCIAKRLRPGWAASAELMSAAEKEGFYAKLGYSDKCGTGMMKMIRR